MSECNHDCSSCGQECDHKIVKASPLEDSKIKKIVGVLSGKGGVGKSTVSSLLAIELNRKGYKVGILDADITGPSIPKMFGLEDSLMGDEKGVFPLETASKIKAVSVNMMLDSDDTPVLWRGPIVGSMAVQFYSDVHWGELDYLIIDMPPGTSDVALSILQQLPVDELVMVTSPSKLVGMIVGKTIHLAEQTNTKVVGLVENMSYVKCPNCNEKIQLYTEDVALEIAAKYNLEVLVSLPLDPALADLCDNGLVEEYAENQLDKLIENL